MAALNFPASPSDGDTYTPSGSTITYTYSSSKGSWAGSLSGSAVSTVSLSGSTNNQVTTVTGANALTGESNLTFDGSTLAVTGAVTVSGLTTLSGNLIIPNDGDVGSVGATDAIQISSGGIVTFKDDILIKDSGTIGSASDPDAITIGSDGTVTFSSNLTVTGTTTLNGNLVLGDAAADTLTIGATLQGASPLTFEGGTADGHETTFAITDPTADRTITFQNATGTVAYLTDNVATATALATARTIGGVSFDGTANIDLPGVNTAGNQNTTGSAATLTTARNIGGVSFNGSANIDLPGVNTAGNQDTSGTAALATLASTVTVSDNSANTNFPVIFHDESNALLDDTGALRYNPSTGTLLVPNLTVAGTTTQVDTVTMNAQNAVIFEGATADGNETTLTITDPTADRTITLPNATGTVALTSSDITGNAATVTSAANNSSNETVYLTFVDGQTGAQEIETDVGLTYNPSTGLISTTSVTAGTLTSTGNLVIANGGNIGSASDTDAISIDGSGIVTISATTGAASTTSGALVVSGGIGLAGDIWIGDDLVLDSDDAMLSFGDDQEVILTHIPDTGLRLNSTMQLQFNDASQHIHAPDSQTLDLTATAEIELNATLIDVNGNLDVSGTYTGAGLMTTGGNIVIPNGGNIGSVSDTDAISIAGDGDVTFSQQIYTSNGTLGAPAIAFSADTDTGIYQAVGSGYIEFGINGTKEFDIRSNGITVKDGGKIGSNGDSDAISIAGDGKVTFSQQLLFESGSTGTPGLAFSADTDTGIYQSGSGLIEFSINGTKEFTINSTGIKGPNDYQIGSEGQQNAMSINSSGAVSFPSAQASFAYGITSVVQSTFYDGSAGSPSVANIGDTDTGMYFPTDNEIAFSTSSSERLRIHANGLYIQDDQYIGSNGDTDAIRIAGNGVVTFSQHAQYTLGLTSTTQIKTTDGSAGTPAIGFSNDTDTGWYSATNGEQNWSLDGTMKMHLDGTGLDVEGTVLCTPTTTLTLADSGGTVQKTVHGVGAT